MKFAIATLIFGVALYVGSWVDQRNRRLLQAWADAVLGDFRRCHLKSNADHLQLDGATAHIVKLERIGGVVDGRSMREALTICIFARNPQGEYFMFRQTGTDRPLIKHVAHNVARLVLKDLYEAPPGA